MDQALQTSLRANPGEIDEAMEEIMRRYSFVVPPRRVARDLELLGVNMKKNDLVILRNNFV